MNATPQLRPLDLGDILDGTFRLYRNNFVTFLGIVALLLVPLSILKILFAVAIGSAGVFDQLDQFQQPGMPPIPGLEWLAIYSAYSGSGLNSLLNLVQGFAIQPLLTTALVYAAARRYMGMPVSIGESYRFGFNNVRFLYVLASQLLISIGIGLALVLPFVCVIFGLVFAFAGVGAAGGDGGGLAAVGIVGGLLAFLLVGALIVASLYLNARLQFYPQAIVIEGRGPTDGIARSWKLVRGSVWRTVGIYLVLSLLSSVMALVILLLFLAIGVALGVTISEPIESYGLIISFFELIQLFVSLLVTPLLLIGLTLLYYDLRVRTEGLDLEMQAATPAPAL